MPWYLVARDGPMTGSAFRLLTDSVSIGRDSNNDIVVEDHLVSRHHARLERQTEDGYAVLDLGSTNGSWVNSQRVNPSTPIVVHYGDSLTLGTKSTFILSNQPFIEEATVMAAPSSRPQPPAGAHPPTKPMPSSVSSARPAPSTLGRPSSWICPSCETPNPVGTRFCGSCGAQLTIHREVVCAACGTLNEAGRRFCGTCGQPLAAPPAAKPARTGSGPSMLLVAAGAVAVLVVLAIIALALAFALNMGGVRDGLAAPSPPERALVLADEYVAGHHAEYVNANRQLTPITTDGQRTYAVRYSLSGGESLLLVVDPRTESVTVLSPLPVDSRRSPSPRRRA